MADETEYFSSALVTFTIQVTGKGHWGKTATVAEVMRNGGRETISAVHRALTEGGLKYVMVSEPKVGAITWSPK